MIVKIFAAIGAIWVGWNIVWPLMDALFYAIGYTLFMWVSTDWRAGKWWQRPHRAAWFLFLRWPIKSFWERMTDFGTVTDIRHGNWHWQPYCHIRKSR